MDAKYACFHLDAVRLLLPDRFARVRDYDVQQTIPVPGVGEHVSVDFWSPVMAAHMEVQGKLEKLAECVTDNELLAALIDCLLESDSEDFTNAPELGERSRELAVRKVKMCEMIWDKYGPK